jgi:hypothetical protein
VLDNAVNGSSAEQKTKMVDAGIIKALTSSLQLQTQGQLLQIAMQTISTLLEFEVEKHSNNTNNHNDNQHPWAIMFEDFGGLDLLESIQANESLSEQCCQMSVEIIERFFNFEIDAHNNGQQFVLQPTIDSKSNQFTFGVSVATNKNKNNNSLQ